MSRRRLTRRRQVCPTTRPKKLIAEYAFVAAATLFEGFISDLFVGYINRDIQKFRDYLLGKIGLDPTDEYAKRAAQHVEKSNAAFIT